MKYLTLVLFSGEERGHDKPMKLRFGGKSVYKSKCLRNYNSREIMFQGFVNQDSILYYRQEIGKKNTEHLLAENGVETFICRHGLKS